MRFLLVALLALPILAADSQPTLPAAMAKLQSGDAAGAAKMLEALVKKDPADGRLWRALGNASKAAKDYPRAIAAYNKALSVDPDSVGPIYQLGTVYALQGKNADAFTWLEKARKTKRIDMTQIDSDKALESLKAAGAKRFAKLHPTRADFDKPFVEPVKIVREWDGEHAGDQFGWIARAIGDVDGDKVVDIVTSAPTFGSGAAANSGRVYVYSTASGKLLWTADGKPEDQLGTGIEAAGDANGDGIPDVVASSPGGGKAFIYSGRDGHVLQTLIGESKDDNFGAHVAGVGDVDHDGHADVLVGAPQNSANGKASGRAYVFSGKDGSTLLTLSGAAAGEAFGSAVAGWSDSKRMLLMVGAPGAGASKTGRTYVYDALTQTPKFTLDADATGRALGAMFLTILGDVNGDGMPDVYASDWVNAAKGPATGRVYVASGADGKPLYAFTGDTQGEGFGTSSSVAGDVDGDGSADLIVGSWQYAKAAMSGGRATLISGRDGHVMGTITCKTPGDTFGFDAVGLGDIDHDGAYDFLITSGWSGVHGFHSGRVFIVSAGSFQRPR
jgi:hypothetical protein